MEKGKRYDLGVRFNSDNMRCYTLHRDDKGPFIYDPDHEFQAQSFMPESGWISVKDRMPEMIILNGQKLNHSRTVIWWVENYPCFGFLEEDGTIYDNGEGFKLNPTHWMSSPRGPIKEPT